MTRPLTCTRCGAPATIAEDVAGHLDWGLAVIADDGSVHPADRDHEPPALMADNADTTGRPRACCTNRDCGHQWRLRRRFETTRRRTVMHDQDRGEAARRAAGIDGTTGDAQDIRHRFVRDDRTGGCLLCGLAETYRKHIDRPLDCGLCFEEDGEEIHPHPECPVRT